MAVGNHWHDPVGILLGVNQDLLQLNGFRYHGFIRWRVGNHLEVVLFQSGFQLLQDFLGYHVALVGQNFPGFRVSQSFCQRQPEQPILHSQLLVGLVTPNRRHVVTLWIKEAGVQQTPGGVSCLWFTRPQAFINVLQGFFNPGVFRILVHILVNRS